LKWKLARLSASTAFLTLSTEDFSTVIVTEDHVKEVVEFLRDEYTKAGLNILAQEEKFEVLSQEDVEFVISNIVYKSKENLDRETIVKAIKFIVLQGRVTRDQLMTKFGLAEKNQLRPLLASLSNEKMLKAGRGLYPTPRLVQAYKVLNVAKVTDVTNPQKGLPKKSEANAEKVGGFSPDLGKLGNLGNINSKIKAFLETVNVVVPLDPPVEDKCGLCDKKLVLYWQLQNPEEDWLNVCQNCGMKFQQFLRGDNH